MMMNIVGRFSPFLLTLCVFGDSSVFIAFGDWGEDSAQLSEVSARLHRESPEFVVLLGDNFYPSGVKSVDDSQFGLFEKLSSVASKFYAILGNHDYGYSASKSAQIAYSKVNSKWHMPHNFHSKAVYPLGSSGYSLCMVFLDTHVFEADQVAWLGNVLSSPECQSRRAFRLVFGHYPVYSAGIYADSSEVRRIRSKLEPILVKRHVHAYISGHEHQFQAIENGGIHYLVSGATAQMNRKKGKNVTEGKVKFFQDRQCGFLRVKFDEDSAQLIYEFVAAEDGSVLYSNRLKAAAKHDETITVTTVAPEPTVIETVTKVESNVVESPVTASTSTTKKPSSKETTRSTVLLSSDWKEFDEDAIPATEVASESLTSSPKAVETTVSCLLVVVLGSYFLLRV